MSDRKRRPVFWLGAAKTTLGMLRERAGDGPTLSLIGSWATARVHDLPGSPLPAGPPGTGTGAFWAAFEAFGVAAAEGHPPDGSGAQRTLRAAMDSDGLGDLWNASGPARTGIAWLDRVFEDLDDLEVAPGEALLSALTWGANLGLSALEATVSALPVQRRAAVELRAARRMATAYDAELRATKRGRHERLLDALAAAEETLVTGDAVPEQVRVDLEKVAITDTGFRSRERWYASRAVDATVAALVATSGGQSDVSAFSLARLTAEDAAAEARGYAPFGSEVLDETFVDPLLVDELRAQARDLALAT